MDMRERKPPGRDGLVAHFGGSSQDGSVDQLVGGMNKWHQDASGVWRREAKPRMSWRCLNWDYKGLGTYLITLVLADRQTQAFGRVQGNPVRMEASALGQAILERVEHIPSYSPEIAVLGVQLMPDHLHLVLKVKQHLKKPLGEHLRGFKIGCTQAAQRVAFSDIHVRADQRKTSLFEVGFVDTLLPTEQAVSRALAYLADNPRRLWEKRQHPELFRVVRDVQIPLELGEQMGVGHFMALGNHHLLECPQLVQVQCSRHEFAYRTDAQGVRLKESEATCGTSTFEEKAADLLDEAKRGAVLVSPCISQGEQEIARRAFEAGSRVIAFQHQGFAPLFKPSGKLFDACMAGHLLLLVPSAWPYTPGKNKLTRERACILNRVAQAISADGAVSMAYRGYEPRDIEGMTQDATEWHRNNDFQGE